MEKTLTRREWDHGVVGLRALSVVFVLIYHTQPDVLKGGYLGVDIFFVISGYLMTRQIYPLIANGNFSSREYFRKRASRLLPALVLMMSVSLVVGYFYCLPDEYRQLGRHIGFGAPLFNNHINLGEDGYFETASEKKAMLHLWSLAVESQFYVLLPLVLCAAKGKKGIALGILILLGSISFGANFWLRDVYPQASFYLVLGRFWEFCCGSILGMLLIDGDVASGSLGSAKDSMVNKLLYRFPAADPQSGNGIELRSVNILLITGLCLILFSVMFGGRDNPLTHSIVTVVGSILVIYVTPKTPLGRMLLGNRLAVGISLISYSLYLWHWPILVYFRIGSSGSLSFDLPATWCALAWILALASISYKLIEEPIRNLSRGGLSCRPLILILFGVWFSGLWVYSLDGVTPYNKPLSYISAAKGDWSYPGKLVYKDGNYQTSNIPPSVMFIGDSHMEQYGPRLEAKYREGLALESIFITGGGCPLIPGVHLDGYEHCDRLFERIRVALNRNPIHTIIIGAYYNAYLVRSRGSKYYYADGGARYHMDSEYAIQSAKKSLYAYIKGLSNLYRVVVVMDNPSDPRFEPSHILANSDSGVRPFPLDVKVYRPKFPQDADQLKLELEMSHALGDYATVVRPSLKICPNAVCEALTVDGHPKYKDGDHIRPFYVKEYIDILDSYFLTHSASMR